MADVHPAAGEETQWVMVVLVLKACAGRSRSAYNRPLYGRLYAVCSKLHRELTDLGTLCGSSENEGFADPIISV